MFSKYIKFSEYIKKFMSREHFKQILNNLWFEEDVLTEEQEQLDPFLRPMMAYYDSIQRMDSNQNVSQRQARSVQLQPAIDLLQNLNFSLEFSSQSKKIN
ncbi:Hypothetical_protein [Hexamita inflata]|uniref:Hypothetical_protein n=1 Tax=Hexamita inflata TaxID=28002 RepID=A0AA86RSS1_9EUKA|nr:Hypothetical protein HINF_LOCUS64974 [Hexamita inflata]